MRFPFLGAVAQSVRASACHAEGREFESRQPRQSSPIGLRLAGAKITKFKRSSSKIVMYYVYLIKSLELPDKFYVGYTTDLVQRLETHNSGGSFHTAKYRPWELVMYLGFISEVKAKDFEKYLKSHSGRAFLVKRFL